jgi:hypothetical protein
MFSSATTPMVSVFALLNEYLFPDPKDHNLIEGKEPRIGPNGMVRLLNDLNIDPTSLNALVLAYKLNAQIQSEFSQKEFREGLREMR